MAVALEVAQEVKKGPRRAKPSAPWYRRPTPTGMTLALALATGIFGVVEGWRAFGGDPGPKRWKTVAEFEISAAIPAVEEPKVTLGASSERDVKTSSDISAQYEKLGIDITPDFLRIMRESERGLDGVGNTRVPLTLATDPEMIWKQYPQDQQPALHHDPRDPIVLLVTHFNGDGVDKQTDGDNRQPATGDKVAKDGNPRNSRSTYCRRRQCRTARYAPGCGCFMRSAAWTAGANPMTSRDKTSRWRTTPKTSRMSTS